MERLRTWLKNTMSPAHDQVGEVRESQKGKGGKHYCVTSLDRAPSLLSLPKSSPFDHSSPILPSLIRSMQ